MMNGQYCLMKMEILYTGRKMFLNLGVSLVNPPLLRASCSKAINSPEVFHISMTGITPALQ